MRHRTTWAPVLAIVAAGAVAAACTESATAPGTTTTPAGATTSSKVSLSVASGSGSRASASKSPRLSVSQTVGGDELVLDSVSLVLREIELKRQDNDTCESSADACEEFETGPILLELPLDGTVDQQVSVDVPAGTYDKLEFEIHKPEDDGNEVDRAFLQDHPDFARISIRARGTFNGTDFTFTSDLNAEQEKALVPALVVDGSSGPTNVTLSVDASTWFVASDGSLIDPSTANKGGANENVVKDNIIASLRAFEDRDEDGMEDGS